jgi:hypothetical protein
MKNSILLLTFLSGQQLLGQDTIVAPAPQPTPTKDVSYIWVFSSPRLINANTVEMIPRHVLEFKVTHNFGDIAGDNGGSKTFFGLDNATDVRIGFQYGLSKRINLIAARSKGAGAIQQLYELGIKYRLMQQAEDAQHPLSVTLFANNVIAAMTKSPVPGQESSFEDFSDRNSQTVQLMIARKLGKLSLQISPTMVHRNFVQQQDDQTLFALGGALRVPVKGRFSLLLDYFHTFHSQTSVDYYKTQGVHFYDALGVGLEFLTEGHVFHLNFTNATEILESRFIPRTVTSWGKGQYRWGFTIARDFNLFYKKKNKKR